MSSSVPGPHEKTVTRVVSRLHFLSVVEEILTVHDPARVALFDAIFGAHFHYVCRTLRRLGVADADVEDEAHDLFIAVFHKLDARTPPTRETSWLFAFAVRIAADYRSSARQRREVVTDDPAASAVEAETPATHYAARQSREIVLSALQAIDNVDQRAVFILSELDEVPLKEVAETLGISHNTAHSRLRLARAEFERAIARHKLKDFLHGR